MLPSFQPLVMCFTLIAEDVKLMQDMHVKSER